MTRYIFAQTAAHAHNNKIKRNKFFWGFVRNLKVSASNKQLWLMKVSRYLSPKKNYFFNPYFVIKKLPRIFLCLAVPALALKMSFEFLQ